MISFAEKPFTINGVESWIHCLDCRFAESVEKMKEQKYHYHDYIEFLYTLDGDVNVWVAGTPHRMVTGELVVINSGEMHTLTFNRDSHYICVKFSPRVLYFDDNSLFEFKYVTPFMSDVAPQKTFRREDFKGVDVHALCIEILDEWNFRRPAYELSIRANILKIFMEIFRYWDREKLAHPEAVLTESVKRALLYISEHFDSISESDVAEFCHLSYNHFSTLFKKSVGRSFNDYVTMLRLNEAEKLIVSSEKSITEIAFSCGFASSSHFISRFKAQKGITPGQLRKKVR